MNNKKIGVLGGIGPEATGEFYNKLIVGFQKKGLIKTNKDFPQIIINSIPAPELIYEKISDDDLQPYLEALKELDNMNVDFIVMVCNTIHLFYEKLQKELTTPILDLREQLRKYLEKNNKSTIFVLGTPNTIQQGLYEFKGIKTLSPTQEETRELTNAIFNFNKGVEKEKQADIVKKICQKYIEKGAESVVLGCTEFALMLGEKNLPTINTIDVLVDGTIETSYKSSTIT